MKEELFCGSKRMAKRKVIAVFCLLGWLGQGFIASRSASRQSAVARHAEQTEVALETSDSPLLAPLKVASAGMGLLKPVFAAEARLQALSYDEEEIRGKILADVKSAPVVIYTYSLSPFCTEAVKLLKALGADFKEIELAPEWFLMLGENAAKRAELGSLYGRTSMPQIFIGGESIGGLMEGPGLVPLYESGELEAKLKAAGAVPQDPVSSLLASLR